MFSKLRKAFASGPAPVTRVVLDDAPPLIYAVGDIHGCFDLYQKLEHRIAADAHGRPALIVLLGDMVDRGAATAALLDHISADPPGGLTRMAVMGNHERLMCDFFDAPRANSDWLRHGGMETLTSYGLAHSDIYAGRSNSKHLQYLLDSHVPPEHLAYLRTLPGIIQAGPCVFCHAGLDPARPLDAQPEDSVLWGRNMGTAPPDGLTLIHGHVPQTHVSLDKNPICVDTGAYATGILSAVKICDGKPLELIQVS